jgi:hypothetical protein
MRVELMKRTIAVGWIIAIGILALGANVTSLPAWVFLVAVAFGPPVTMLLLWKNPPQTISESIHQARR